MNSYYALLRLPENASVYAIKKHTEEKQKPLACAF